MSKDEALQQNIDAAQRELNRRFNEGEDVSRLRVCQETGAILPMTTRDHVDKASGYLYAALGTLSDAVRDGTADPVAALAISRLMSSIRGVAADMRDVANAMREQAIRNDSKPGV